MKRVHGFLNFQELVILHIEEIHEFFEQSVIEVVFREPRCQLLSVPCSAECSFV